MAIFGVSRRLSLTLAGSLTKASLGAVSGMVVEVTHSGSGPEALVATQPAGKAGVVTPSNSSLNTVGHGVPVAEAVAVAVGVGVPLGVGVGHAPKPKISIVLSRRPPLS